MSLLEELLSFSKHLLKGLIPLILNIILLFFSMAFTVFLMKVSMDGSRKGMFLISIFQWFFITIQYLTLFINQIKFKKKLSKYFIYRYTRLTNFILITVLFFLSLFLKESMYLTSIYILITTLIFSLLVKKLNGYLIIQSISLLLIYLTTNVGLISISQVKNFYLSLFS